MGKYLVICVVCIITSCKSKQKTVLSFNIEPAEKFIELIDYLESKSEAGFNSNIDSKELIKQQFELNRRDTLLIQKIEALLSLPVYNELGKITATYIDSIEYTGKEAYRLTFLNLPSSIPRMRGAVAEQWVDFWKKGFDKPAALLLQEIKSQEKKVIHTALNNCYNLLPDGIPYNQPIEVIFCFDGNRGSYAKDNTIVMDMLDFPSTDISHFNKVLAHELHHVIYGDWLHNDLLKINITIKNNALFKYQRRIIVEGIAQQITYPDYSNQVKNLYNNKALIEELFVDWINTMRQIAKSKQPNLDLQHINKEMWGSRSNKWLKKYVSNEIEEETFSRRPTTDYYISYHLYNAIYQKGGIKRLKYVVKNYDCLLEEYNNIYASDLLIPKIPSDVVSIWQNTFNR